MVEARADALTEFSRPFEGTLALLGRAPQDAKLKALDCFLVEAPTIARGVSLYGLVQFVRDVSDGERCHACIMQSFCMHCSIQSRALAGLPWRHEGSPQPSFGRVRLW